MRDRLPRWFWLVSSLLTVVVASSVTWASDLQKLVKQNRRPHRTSVPSPASSVAVTVLVVPDIEIPKRIALEQNGPNPFATSTAIRFDLPLAQYVSLRVYNTSGQEIVVLIDRTVEAGCHRIEWDGRDSDGHSVSSGVYYCRMVTKGYSKTTKMLRVR